jgi:seryl-tRNA synthetase
VHVIDPKLLRTDPDRLRRAQEARGESPELIDQLLSADEARRGSIAAFERSGPSRRSSAR